MIRSKVGRLLLSSIVPLLVLAAVLGPLAVGLRLLLFSGGDTPTGSAVLSTVVTLVEVQGVGSNQFQPSQVDRVLVGGDDVRTSTDGRGLIDFIDNSQTVLQPGSQLQILPPARRDGGIINRLRQSFGTSWSQFTAIAGGGGSYEIETASGVVSVRDGAVVRVGVGQDADKTAVTLMVLQGSANFNAPTGSEDVNAGQMVTVTEGEAPPAPEAIHFSNQILISVSSNFDMLVQEPETGLTTGIVPPGDALDQIVLSVGSAPGSYPETVLLGEPRAGTYTIHLIPRGEPGNYALGEQTTANDQVVSKEVIPDETTGCEWLDYTVNIGENPSGDITSVVLSGPTVATSLPSVRGLTRIDTSCPPPNPLVAQVHGVVATATPEPSPTPVPTPGHPDISIAHVQQSVVPGRDGAYALLVVVLGAAAVVSSRLLLARGQRKRR